MSELITRDDGPDLSESAADDRPDPERQAMARRMLSKIEALFADDVQALSVLTGLATGLTPSEIQESEKLSARNYATTQKRIRRAITRALREGEL